MFQESNGAQRSINCIDGELLVHGICPVCCRNVPA
jgi:hypothetical protein